jgi:hypothetical protein
MAGSGLPDQRNRNIRPLRTCVTSAGGKQTRLMPVTRTLGWTILRDPFSSNCSVFGGTCKIRLSDEKAGQPEEFCAEEAAFFRMATGFGCYRMGEGTKLGVFGHAATEGGY